MNNVFGNAFFKNSDIFNVSCGSDGAKYYNKNGSCFNSAGG